jgi:isocitrate/isopropylmalate dehydrogenase
LIIPIKRERIEGTDLVLRELTGGIYFGEKIRRRRNCF